MLTDFTTRPDTIYGVTFMSMAPEHPLVMEFARKSGREVEVAAFVEKVSRIDKIDRMADEFEKEGVFTGGYCVNPLTGERVPVFAANFVLYEYGTGAVMAVPAHDQRDFEFARKYTLPVKVVIQSQSAPVVAETMSEAFVAPGLMVASGMFSGTSSEAGKKAVIEHIAANGFGRGKVQYRLRDWGISRQRYWGAPIPVIHCESCGIVPVPEKDLPVVLPEDIAYTRERGNPLVTAEDWVRVPCPACGRAARRETDTFDTFMESSWYFLRYIDPKNATQPLDPEKMTKWMCVDQYVGGVEHACMHLMYARFFNKFLRDKGLTPGNEPFLRLLSQGMVCMTTNECPKHGWRYPEEVDQDGNCVQCGEKVTVGRSVKMSKSKRNVVEPSTLVARYGADTARLFSLFAAPPEKDLDWSEQGVEGSFRFLNRVYRLVAQHENAIRSAASAIDSNTDGARPIRNVTHRTLKKVTADIEDRSHFNTAISAVMEMVNFLYLVPETDWEAVPTASALKEAIETLLLMLTPFAPHLAEELWSRIGHEEMVCTLRWPDVDESAVREEQIEVVIQVNGKLRSKLIVSPDTDEETIRAAALADPRILEYIEGKTVRKIVYVPRKLVSIVV